ncbi:hypothetical protein CAOG_006753 [Capsaspora owczarzaki ATCC 30864]|uniref:Uncharacterized protein n=1 Tax=Capsaspora owczarzaki (strain ATCC 30864) TaxID=595528 RepID=A0A0D2VXM6_CAPO3|nr:hypothetical protein CAOG_006753 [Capsaspora owczarzaki ATCC 30864]
MTQRLHERRNAAAATTDAATASSHNNHHGHPHSHAHAHHHQSHHSAAAHGRHDMQADHPSPAVFTPPAFSDHHAANHADRGWGNFGGPHLRSHGLTPGASGHHETSNLLSIPVVEISEIETL